MRLFGANRESRIMGMEVLEDTGRRLDSVRCSEREGKAEKEGSSVA